MFIIFTAQLKKSNSVCKKSQTCLFVIKSSKKIFIQNSAWATYTEVSQKDMEESRYKKHHPRCNDNKLKYRYFHPKH